MGVPLRVTVRPRLTAPAILLLAILAACPASPSSAATWLVRPDGTGDVPTLRIAVIMASPGDIIELADGTFLGDGNRDVDLLGKDLIFRSQAGSAASCIIDCENAGWGFWLHGGETPAAVIEAVTITHAAGSAIRIEGASPTVRNCIFTANNASFGAGIYCYNGSPAVSGCTFIANAAGTFPDDPNGAGFFCSGAQATVVLAGCAFRANTGGGVGAFSSAGVTITGCTFADNHGTPVAVGSQARILVASCTFTGNIANGAGGVGVLAHSEAQCEVRDCTFTGNTGNGEYYGIGGVDAGDSGVVTDCLFLDNSGGWMGAAGAGERLERCTFRANDGLAGAAIARGTVSDCNFFGNSMLEGGALWACEATVTRCIFAGNSCPAGGALYVDNCFNGVTLSRSTFWNNHTGNGGAAVYARNANVSLDRVILSSETGGPAIFCSELGEVTAVCCDFYGNEGGDWTGCVASQDGANGNISADPLFCDPSSENFTLRSDSPCAPEHNPECGLIGVWQVGCAPPTAIEALSWGRVKSRFRDATR